MSEGGRSADEFAEELEKRAERARAAALTERATEEHLDSTLARVGFQCLHDCRWPGTRKANIDHVVIGPTGVWVVDDKRSSYPVRLSKGRLWHGRYPMDTDLRKARAQAVAVARSLGIEDVSSVLSVHASSVPHPTIVDGVHIAAAFGATVGVLTQGERSVSSDEVATLADRARRVLSPRSVSAPSARASELPGHTSADSVIGDYPPDFDQLAPPTLDLTRRPLRRRLPVVPSAPSPTRHARRTRSGLGSELLALLLRGVLALIVMSALLSAASAIGKASSKGADGVEPVAGYSCSAPGEGWSLDVSWSSDVTRVEWSATGAEPWHPLWPTGFSSGQVPKIAPETTTHLRFERRAAPSSMTTTSPLSTC